jgi:diphthamide biosynthesis protein 2
MTRAHIKIEFDTGERVMKQEVSHAIVNVGDYTLAEYYDISGSVKAVRESGACRIALQFPDNMLMHSATVSSMLRKALGDGHMVFILGDTTYSPCCVDEVAALHLNADFIIHYGR